MLAYTVLNRVCKLLKCWQIAAERVVVRTRETTAEINDLAGRHIECLGGIKYGSGVLKRSNIGLGIAAAASDMERYTSDVNAQRFCNL
jgi:hypothetical protein